MELVSEPKMVMMETFLMAISQTDSRYSSLCWTYILFSSRGAVISCSDRRRGVQVLPVSTNPTHTHTHTDDVCRSMKAEYEVSTAICSNHDSAAWR